MASLHKEKADEVWNDMDQNKDGQLSIKELKRGLEALGKSVCRDRLIALFVDLDKDGDKSLSYQEYAECYKKARKNALNDFFSTYDTDKSGSLERAEFETAVKQAGCFDDSEISRLIALADVNDDGKISYEEFLKHMEQQS